MNKTQILYWGNGVVAIATLKENGKHKMEYYKDAHIRTFSYVSNEVVNDISVISEENPIKTLPANTLIIYKDDLTYVRL